MVGDAGLLLIRVLYTKTCGAKEFVIVDAGMNALVRPVLYGARHRVGVVEPRPGDARVVDIVGPICENGDFLARECSLPPLERGDLLAVLDSGAYGFAMASQYNSQPRPAEVLVQEGRANLVRARETYKSLVEGEAPCREEEATGTESFEEDRPRCEIGMEKHGPFRACATGRTGEDRSQKGEDCE